MDRLREAILEQQSLQEIKSILLSVARPLIEQEDGNNLTLLHYAILANYVEVTRLLFLHGFFLQPHIPTTVTYLHLGSHLGYVAIVNLVLEYRPDDIRMSIASHTWIESLRALVSTGMLDVEAKQRSNSINKNNSDSSFGSYDVSVKNQEQIKGEGDGKLKEPFSSKGSQALFEQRVLSAVDIAAKAGNIRCVRLLLYSSASQCRCNSILERAVELNSYLAVLLIIQEKSSPVQDDEIHGAFKEALRRKLYRCMDVLLSAIGDKKEVYKMFNGLNPYHVMYMYSSAYQVFGKEFRNYGLSECTEALVKHKLDINVKEPVGSYPLYSLIHSMVVEKDYSPSKVPLHHLQSLLILLKNGADPNFDEAEYSKRICAEEDFGSFPTLGRELYTSALSALFGALQQSDTWRGFVPDYIVECCEVLLQYGASPIHIDTYGDTPLHDLMKCLAMQHSMGHMNLQLGGVVMVLLKNGCDPNMKSTDDVYPVICYFSLLLNLMGGLIAFERWKMSGVVHQVFQLLQFMDHDSVIEASHMIEKHFHNAKKDGMPEEVMAYIENLMSKFTSKPKSLLELGSLATWKHVQRNEKVLSQLLPKPLVTRVMSMFDCLIEN